MNPIFKQMEQVGISYSYGYDSAWGEHFYHVWKRKLKGKAKKNEDMLEFCRIFKSLDEVKTWWESFNI